MPDPKKHYLELGIEFCLELAIGLYQLGAEQMELPHNFWIGLFLWIAATGLALRMFWIFPKIEKWRWEMKLSIATIAVIIFIVLAWKPIRAAYRKGSVSPASAPTLSPLTLGSHGLGLDSAHRPVGIFVTIAERLPLRCFDVTMKSSSFRVLKIRPLTKT